jgi:ssDNA thymidine ADP-ribosyltransferase, DarT
MDIQGTVITDQNASSKYARFASAPDGITIVDYDRTFAEDWRDPDQITYWRKKSMKCAEVLVPDRIPPGFLTGVYCSCEASTSIVQAASTLDCTVNGYLFFQSGSGSP